MREKILHYRSYFLTTHRLKVTQYIYMRHYGYNPGNINLYYCMIHPTKYGIKISLSKTMISVSKNFDEITQSAPFDESK